MERLIHFFEGMKMTIGGGVALAPFIGALLSILLLGEPCYIQFHHRLDHHGHLLLDSGKVTTIGSRFHPRSNFFQPSHKVPLNLKTSSDATCVRTDAACVSTDAACVRSDATCV